MHTLNMAKITNSYLMKQIWQIHHIALFQQHIGHQDELTWKWCNEMKWCTHRGEHFDMLHVQIGATDAEIRHDEDCQKISVVGEKVNREISDPDLKTLGLTFPSPLIFLQSSSCCISAPVTPICAYSISKCSSRRVHHFISLHHFHLCSSWSPKCCWKRTIRGICQICLSK